MLGKRELDNRAKILIRLFVVSLLRVLERTRVVVGVLHLHRGGNGGKIHGVELAEDETLTLTGSKILTFCVLDYETK